MSTADILRDIGKSAVNTINRMVWTVHPARLIAAAVTGVQDFLRSYRNKTWLQVWIMMENDFAAAMAESQNNFFGGINVRKTRVILYVAWTVLIASMLITFYILIWAIVNMARLFKQSTPRSADGKKISLSDVPNPKSTQKPSVKSSSKSTKQSVKPALPLFTYVSPDHFFEIEGVRHGLLQGGFVYFYFFKRKK